MDFVREALSGRFGGDVNYGPSRAYEECYDRRNRCGYRGGHQRSNGGDIAAQVGLGMISNIFGNVMGARFNRGGYYGGDYGYGRGHYDDYGYGRHGRWGGGYDDYYGRRGGYDDYYGRRWGGGYDDYYGRHNRHNDIGKMLAIGIGGLIGGSILNGIFGRNNRHHHNQWNRGWGHQQHWGQQHRNHYRHGGRRR